MLPLDETLLRNTDHVVRNSMPTYQWDLFASRIVESRQTFDVLVRKAEGEADRSLGPADDFRARALQRIPRTLSAGSVAAMRVFLEQQPTFAGFDYLSSDGTQRSFAESRQLSHFVSYVKNTLVQAPHLVDVINDPAIVDFVESFLGCVPTLYALHAWWSFPGENAQGYAMEHFHRDTDDWRFCTLFLYLTDVDKDGGPHQIIEGSHTLAGMEQLAAEAPAFDVPRSFFDHTGASFSENCERLLADRITNVQGPAGTMFIANTTAIHRGLMPTKAPRLMVSARYGLGVNSNTKDRINPSLARDKVPSTLADTQRNRFINRLMFDF